MASSGGLHARRQKPAPYVADGRQGRTEKRNITWAQDGCQVPKKNNNEKSQNIRRRDRGNEHSKRVFRKPPLPHASTYSSSSLRRKHRTEKNIKTEKRKTLSNPHPRNCFHSADVGRRIRLHSLIRNGFSGDTWC